MAQMKVRYKGASDRRILPADQLAERGVKGIDKDLVFEPQNMWAQTVEMSDELEAILRMEGTFTLEPIADDGSTGADESGLPDDNVAIDDTADTVVMSDTGQVDKATETGKAGQLAPADDKENTNAPLSSGTETGGGTTSAVNSSTSPTSGS